MRRMPEHRRWKGWFLVAVVVLATATGLFSPRRTDRGAGAPVPAGGRVSGIGVPAAGAAGGAFAEAFDGAPASPRPWRPADWDVQVHSRDRSEWHALAPVDAHHGPGCEPPGDAGRATHRTSGAYAEAVFLCRDHVMTAMDAAGYGAIYLTPPVVADWSPAAGGEAVVAWDMTTRRSSDRDWVDLWVTPYDEHLALPLEDWLPDLQGYPRRALFVRMDGGDQGAIFRVKLVEDFRVVGEYQTWSYGLERLLAARGTAASAQRRDRFELRLSRGRVWFGMPQYGIVLADAAVPGLTWEQGAVQFGHHSYNPDKCDPPGACRPNTWHWDDVRIAPAVPFALLRADRRAVSDRDPDGAGREVAFPAPAPPGARLRFAALSGAPVEVSFDGGAFWAPAQKQAATRDQTDLFASYWHPVPEGTRRARFRGVGGYWSQEWIVKDVALFGPPGAPAPFSPSPPAPAPAAPPPPATAWAPARKQAATRDQTDLFASYWHPVPEGTRRARFRGVGGYWSQEWIVKDVALFGPPGAPAPFSPSPTATATASPPRPETSWPVFPLDNQPTPD